MEGLIQATKDGDMSKFRAFPVSEELVVVDDNEKEEEIESEDDVQVCHAHFFCILHSSSYEIMIDTQCFILVQLNCAIWSILNLILLSTSFPPKLYQ